MSIEIINTKEGAISDFRCTRCNLAYSIVALSEGHLNFNGQLSYVDTCKNCGCINVLNISVNLSLGQPYGSEPYYTYKNGIPYQTGKSAKTSNTEEEPITEAESSSIEEALFTTSHETGWTESPYTFIDPPKFKEKFKEEEDCDINDLF